MSGSSRSVVQGHGFEIALDAGVNISWASESQEAGTQHHRDEEDGFTKKLTALLPAISAIVEAEVVGGSVVLGTSERVVLTVHGEVVEYFELILHCDKIDEDGRERILTALTPIVREQLSLQDASEDLGDG